MKMNWPKLSNKFLNQLAESFNIAELLEKTARSYPHGVAIVDELGELTYSELFEHVVSLQSELEKTRQGKKLRLAICYGNNRDFLIALFAGAGAGYVVMPIFDELTEGELTQQLKDNSIHHFLSARNGEKLSDESFSLQRFSEEEDSDMEKLCSDPAFIRPTSGTTGTSKGVLISHQAVLERINAANKELELTNKDTVIWVLPMAFHFVVSLVLYIAQGSKIVVAGGLDADELADKINYHQGTLLYSSPLHIRLLSQAKSNTNFATLKRVISTTTAISPAICHAFYERFKIPVSQAYGIIEIGLPLINSQSNIDEPDNVGRALPDYEVAIFNDNGMSLPEGESGHLGIRGVGMFSGYLNPLTKREEIMQNGFFMTGDIATQNKDGNVRIVGRKKAMINVSGNKVFPQEVEFILEQHPSIAQARVYADKHILAGEIVAADVILHPNKPTEVESLIHFCREHLTAYKIPQRIKFVEEIEMTSTGKVKR